MQTEQGLKNIEPHKWKKGQSGNPKGRTKGVMTTKKRLEKVLELLKETKNPVTGEIEWLTVAELLDYAIIKKGLKGDVTAYREIFDRFEGKIPMSLSDLGEGAIQVPTTININVMAKPNGE